MAYITSKAPGWSGFSHFDADPHLTFHFDVDMDPALTLGADPDPASNNDEGSERFRISNAAI